MVQTIHHHWFSSIWFNVNAHVPTLWSLVTHIYMSAIIIGVGSSLSSTLCKAFSNAGALSRWTSLIFFTTNTDILKTLRLKGQFFCPDQSVPIDVCLGNYFENWHPLLVIGISEGNSAKVDFALFRNQDAKPMLPLRSIWQRELIVLPMCPQELPPQVSPIEVVKRKLQGKLSSFLLRHVLGNGWQEMCNIINLNTMELAFTRND